MNASWDDGVSCTILWVTVTLTSDLVFRKIVSGEYLILLKVRIPNLVCGCNFWWRPVTYHFWVTLTSDLVYRIIVSRTYLLYNLRWESQIFCMDTSFDADVSHTILGHCDLDLWPSFLNNRVWIISPILFDVGIPNLVCWFLLGWRSGAYHFESLLPWHWLLASFLGFSCLEHISYITAKFPRMCLMLDQILWGHSPRDCDISCWFPYFEMCNITANRYAHICKNSLSFKIKVKLYEKTKKSYKNLIGKINVVKQWGSLVGLRPACLT